MQAHKVSKPLLVCLIVLATPNLFCGKAQAMGDDWVIGDTYDPAFDAKIKIIADDIKISDYEEHPVNAPGLEGPIGLDVSFKVTQTLGNNFNISLMDYTKFAFGVVCKESSKYPGDTYYANPHDIKGEVETILRYRCMPPGRAWDEGKPLDASGRILDSLAVYSNANEPAPGTKLGASLRIEIENPDCQAHLPVIRKPHTAYSCVNYWQDIISKLPVNLLDDGTFWHNALIKSSPEAIAAAGRYALCDTQGYYCRQDKEKLDSAIISNYKERAFKMPGFPTPVGLYVSFDVEQKLNSYISVSLQTPNKPYTQMSCTELSNPDQNEEDPGKHTAPYIMGGGFFKNGGDHNYPLKEGKTKASFFCGPTMFNFPPATGFLKPDPTLYTPHIMLFMYDSDKGTHGLDVTDKLIQFMKPSSKLANSKFWNKVIMDLTPESFAKAGYFSCEPGFVSPLSKWCREPPEKN